MSEFVTKFNDNITTKVLPNHIETTSEGRVIRANEKENVCDIIYENSAGKLERVTNVEVELLTGKENWFPKPGDEIRTKETNDNQPVIIGRLIREYVQDIKPERTKNKDVMASKTYAVRNHTA